VRAVLRRAPGASLRKSNPIKGNTVHFDQWTLDFARQELTGADGIGVALSTVEFGLLKAFLDHPGMVLSRDQLLDLTAGRMADPFDRSIDNQVSRLRKKVEADPKNPSIIKTIGVVATAFQLAW
jgi:two-component system OmpR family response regulator